MVAVSRRLSRLAETMAPPGVIIPAAGLPQQQPRNRPFGIAEQLSLREIGAVALSASGAWVAYTLHGGARLQGELSRQ